MQAYGTHCIPHKLSGVVREDTYKITESIPFHVADDFILVSNWLTSDIVFELSSPPTESSWPWKVTKDD